MLKSTYTVHSAVAEDIPMVVKINGVPTAVKVPGLTIELVNDSEGHTYHFVPEDMEAALAMYVPGATMIVEINAAE